MKNIKLLLSIIMSLLLVFSVSCSKKNSNSNKKPLDNAENTNPNKTTSYSSEINPSDKNESAPHLTSSNAFISSDTSSKNYLIIVDRIELKVPTDTIFVGDKLKINAVVFPFNATYKKLSFSSSDESVATVDNNGLVTALNPGGIKITAKNEYGDSETIRITVRPKTKMPCHLKINGVPKSISLHSKKGELISSLRLDFVDYEFKKNSNGTFDLHLYMSGEKLTDIKGENNKAEFKIQWLLNTSKGKTIRDGEHIIAPLKVKDKFTRAESVIKSLPADQYSMDIISFME